MRSPFSMREVKIGSQTGLKGVSPMKHGGVSCPDQNIKESSKSIQFPLVKPVFSYISCWNNLSLASVYVCM